MSQAPGLAFVPVIPIGQHPSKSARTRNSTTYADSILERVGATVHFTWCQGFRGLIDAEVMPKRPPRANECYGLDKDLAASSTCGQAFDVAQQSADIMDAPNWANLFYALAHFKKKGDRSITYAALRSDPRWSRSCHKLSSCLADLTARDAANVIWSLANLDAKQESLFLQTADALCNGGKLAVCDPMSIAKTAWALTSIPNRDRRLDLFAKLAVPVVLRADTFPLGSLTMICYAFAKADFRDGGRL